MGLDEMIDKSGQSGAGVQVHSDSGDEREQEVKTTNDDKEMPDKGGEEDNGR